MRVLRSGDQQNIRRQNFGRKQTLGKIFRALAKAFRSRQKELRGFHQDIGGDRTWARTGIIKSPEMETEKSSRNKTFAKIFKAMNKVIRPRQKGHKTEGTGIWRRDQLKVTGQYSRRHVDCKFIRLLRSGGQAILSPNIG